MAEEATGPAKHEWSAGPMGVVLVGRYVMLELLVAHRRNRDLTVTRRKPRIRMWVTTASYCVGSNFN
ncbi:hypothetical protein F442_12787 [Phytophthora nicotianae P10297]|uniref:Uncharacterized protein n=1 Tax=Phytophthora nicotianae P10297 TaxID=1317064 RepID=W2YXN5_PHYNI|nr:hypothetical protein F442_12787 [Phytophthora nicotianae P10297]